MWSRDAISEARGEDLLRQLPKGRLEYPDGSLYYGEFLSGAGNGVLVRHGRGRQLALDGSIHVGRWENDRLVERDAAVSGAAAAGGGGGGGAWVSGSYGLGTALVNDESIGRTISSPKKPFWAAKPPPPVHHAEATAGWNVLLGEEGEGAVERGQDDEHGRYGKFGTHWYLSGDDEGEGAAGGEMAEEHQDDADFRALVGMLGGVDSARATEILSIAAGYHTADTATAEAAAADTANTATSTMAAASGDEDREAALLRQLARGMETSCAAASASASSGESLQPRSLGAPILGGAE